MSEFPTFDKYIAESEAKTDPARRIESKFKRRARNILLLSALLINTIPENYTFGQVNFAPKDQTVGSKTDRPNERERWVTFNESQIQNLVDQSKTEKAFFKADDSDQFYPVGTEESFSVEVQFDEIESLVDKLSEEKEIGRDKMKFYNIHTHNLSAYKAFSKDFDDESLNNIKGELGPAFVSTTDFLLQLKMQEKAKDLSTKIVGRVYTLGGYWEYEVDEKNDFIKNIEEFLLYFEDQIESNLSSNDVDTLIAQKAFVGMDIRAGLNELLSAPEKSPDYDRSTKLAEKLKIIISNLENKYPAMLDKIIELQDLQISTALNREYSGLTLEQKIEKLISLSSKIGVKAVFIPNKQK